MGTDIHMFVEARGSSAEEILAEPAWDAMPPGWIAPLTNLVAGYADECAWRFCTDFQDLYLMECQDEEAKAAAREAYDARRDHYGAAAPIWTNKAVHIYGILGCATWVGNLEPIVPPRGFPQNLSPFGRWYACPPEGDEGVWWGADHSVSWLTLRELDPALNPSYWGREWPGTDPALNPRYWGREWPGTESEGRKPPTAGEPNRGAKRKRSTYDAIFGGPRPEGKEARLLRRGLRRHQANDAGFLNWIAAMHRFARENNVSDLDRVRVVLGFDS
jgi:hypothetical protein